MLLTESGRHSWAGRASDPSPEEITRFEQDLHTKSLSGWLCILEGDYWSGGDITLLEVKPLNDPTTPFPEAKASFLRLRATAIRLAE